MSLPIEIPYRRRWDHLSTSARGYLTRAMVAGHPGLPIVRLSGEQYRMDDGRLKGELVDPQTCPPFGLLQQPSTPDEIALVQDALAQGYRLLTGTDPLPIW